MSEKENGSDFGKCDDDDADEDYNMTCEELFESIPLGEKGKDLPSILSRQQKIIC